MFNVHFLVNFTLTNLPCTFIMGRRIKLSTATGGFKQRSSQKFGMQS